MTSGPWGEIAELIRARAKRGDQKIVASRLGIERPALSRYVKGSRVPPPEVGVRIARAFGLDESMVGAKLTGLESVGRVQVVTATDEVHGKTLAGVGAPLVLEDVAAGNGSLPVVPEEKLYFFHETYMVRHGWSAGDRDRFCCIRLGKKAFSMHPTIQPNAVVLIDRRYPEEKLRVLKRGICLVEIPDEGAAVKRVTWGDHVIVIESDNPEPEFHARVIDMRDRATRDVIRGKVLWWSVEASTRE